MLVESMRKEMRKEGRESTQCDKPLDRRVRRLAFIMIMLMQDIHTYIKTQQLQYKSAKRTKTSRILLESFSRL